MADKAVKDALKKARSALSSKDYGTCVRSCEEALAADDKSYDALTILGKAKLGQNAFDQCEAAYKRAINAQKDRTTAWQGLAELYATMAEGKEKEPEGKAALVKLMETYVTLQGLFSNDKEKVNFYKDQHKAADKKLNPPPPVEVVRKNVPAKQPSKKNSKGAGNVTRCAAEGCKERLNDKNTAKCDKCGMLLCLEHQYPVDHDCTGGKPAAKPAAAKPANGGIQVLTKKPPAAAPAAAAPAAPAAPAKAEVTYGEPSELLKSQMTQISVLVDGMLSNNADDVGKVMAALEVKVDIKKKKAPEEDRVNAMLAMELLCDRLGRKFEPFFVKYLPLMFQVMNDGRGNVPVAAMGAARLGLGRIHHAAATLVVPILLNACDERAFRVKESALECLNILAERSPCEIGLAMPAIFPKLQEALQDTHPKVVEAAEKSLEALSMVITQPETLKLMVNLKKAILKPAEMTFTCLDQLMETTFVNAVDAASLSWMMPVVSRGLKEPSADLNKKAATTAGNVCALVSDARDILPFAPMLLPGITKAVDHSHPDVRTAATRARDKLLAGAGLTDEAAIGAMAKSTSTDALCSLGASLEMLPSKAGTTVKAEMAALLTEAVNMGRVAEETNTYIVNLLTTVVRDARTATGVAAALQEMVWPLIADSKVEEAALVASCATLEKWVSTELYSNSTIPEADYIVRIEGIILAFAGKVLLSKTHLLLERTHNYGLIGQNGMGKTTLLNRVAAGDIKGFPKDVSVYYIQHEILSERNDSVLNFMLGQVPEGTTKEVVIQELKNVGFTDVTMAGLVSELSGGWRMKLAIARAMLWNAQLLLLDEPTNHLDKPSVAWLADKLNSLKDTTILLVSHDYDFLKLVLTRVIHIHQSKLTYYSCGFAEFQKENPEIVAALPSPDKTIEAASGGGAQEAAAPTEAAPTEAAAANGEAEAAVPATGLDKVATTDKPINFPDPGRLEGIVGKKKVVLRLSRVAFKYDSAEKAVLTDASGTLCLGSRVALIGANGAGKTTMMKLLVGETVPTEGVGEVWKHHNLRLAYIAQHSMHHLEQALENTPLQYIQNRFYKGMDKELAKRDTMAMDETDKEMMEQRGSILKVVGRQERGKKLWYEVWKNGRKENDTDWEPLQFLENMAPYVMKLVKAYDEEMKAAQSGMAIRPITSIEVRKHLAEFGIDEDLGSQKIKRMSGGQRSRLVLAAAMWIMPHMIALDEPTNYLDNDTLAALTTALKTFKGGVVTISHNAAFVKELCTETWLVENGTVVVNKIAK